MANSHFSMDKGYTIVPEGNEYIVECRGGNNRNPNYKFGLEYLFDYFDYRGLKVRQVLHYSRVSLKKNPHGIQLADGSINGLKPKHRADRVHNCSVIFSTLFNISIHCYAIFLKKYVDNREILI